MNCKLTVRLTTHILQCMLWLLSGVFVFLSDYKTALVNVIAAVFCLLSSWLCQSLDDNHLLRATTIFIPTFLLSGFYIFTLHFIFAIVLTFVGAASVFLVPDIYNNLKRLNLIRVIFTLLWLGGAVYTTHTVHTEKAVICTLYIISLIGGIWFVTAVINTLISTLNERVRLLEQASIMSNIYKQELHHDALTGVYSRGWLMHNIEEKLKHVSGQRRISIGMIDIDHFKHVNDTYGHDAGDIVLKRLGKLLCSLQCAQIFTGRYGGEEFIIVFDSVEHDLAIMKQLLTDFTAQSFKFTEEHFTFSGGLYRVSEEISVEEAIKQADNRLYYSKEHGRNQITTG